MKLLFGPTGNLVNAFRSETPSLPTGGASVPTHADVCEVAKAIVQRSLKIKKGENVIVESWDHQLTLAGDVVYWCRKAGARPLLMVEREEDFVHSVLDLPVANLGLVGSHEWAALEESDAYVFIPGPEDPTIYDKAGKKRPALTRYNDEWYRRARKARVRGSRSLLGYATESRAKLHGVGYQNLRSMVLEASLIDPEAIRKRAERISSALEDGSEVRITGPGGTDLTVGLKYRPIRDDGMTDKRDLDEGYPITYFPGGGVWTALDEGTAEGRVAFDRPAFMNFTQTHGLVLEFRDGRLVDHSYGLGGEAFERAYREGGRGRDILGEMDIGLNPKMSYGTQYDGWVAGSVGLYMGDNTFVNGKNSSDFSAGATLSQASVIVDGETLVRKGKLV